MKPNFKKLTKIISFNLFELILYISILSLLSSIAINSYHKFTIKNKYQINVNNILNAILFAKNYAIINKKNLYLCMSKDLKHCDYSSKKGFIIFSQNKIIKTFDLKNNDYEILKINFFGNKKNNVKIEKDGSTYNNGHLIYKNKKYNLTTYICWNKALKTYASSKSCI